ncbi:2-oxoglutarate ferredoxin oxidoreductase subunit alpha, partial [Streptomyces buecherae]
MSPAAPGHPAPAPATEPAAEPIVGAAPSTAGSPPEKATETLHRVIIRFAGDSGDGMQLTGDRFTSETASFGNDLST